MAQFLMFMGISQVLALMFIIGNTFTNTDGGGHLIWYTASYALTAGVFVLPAGRVGDLFGHKIIFIIGFLWFAIWSLLAGFALLVQDAGGNGSAHFIACRSMQGVGPAMLIANAHALLNRAYPSGPRKNIIICVFSAAAPLGFVLGAVMASLFAINNSWPWAFWVTAAVCLGSGGLSLLVLPADDFVRRDDIAGKELLKLLDVPGIVLIVSGLVLLSFGINQAPVVGWGTPYTYFLVIIGSLLFGTFLYVEKHVEYPLFILSSIKSTAAFVLACTAAGWAAFAIWCFYTFTFLEHFRGLSPLLASAQHAHVPILGFAACLLVVVLLKHQVKPTLIMVTSMVAFLIGSVLLLTAPVEQTYWASVFVALIFMPFGMVMSIPSATSILDNAIAREQQGIAAGLVSMTVSYTISLSLGLAGMIEAQVGHHSEKALDGLRGAQYLGTGFAGVAVCLGFGFLLADCIIAQGNKYKGPPEPTVMKASDP